MKANCRRGKSSPRTSQWEWRDMGSKVTTTMKAVAMARAIIMRAASRGYWEAW